MPVTPARARRPFLILLSALATAAVALAVTPTALAATTASQAADMESGSFAEFDATSVTSGVLQVVGDRSYAGSRSGLAKYDGSGSNGYARGQWDVDWRPGGEVWYGVAVYLPSGFKSAQQGAVDLLRWDNWSLDPQNTDHGGITVDSRGGLRVIKEQLGSQPWTSLLGPFDIPEGRWVWLEVHQRFSAADGSALTELYRDGTRLGTTTTANSYGRPLTRLRTGIVSISAGNQTTPLQLWFDRATISTGAPTGPAGTSGSPPQGSATPWPDTAGSVHEDAIAWLADRDLIQGYADGSFRPGDPVGRGQLASILAGALDLPATDQPPPGDAADSVHGRAIARLVATGLMDGYPDGTFRPGATVTRGQLATAIDRWLPPTGDEPAGMPSDAADSPHADAIGRLVDQGLMVGFADGTFRPDSSVSRGQLASLLARLLNR